MYFQNYQIQKGIQFFQGNILMQKCGGLFTNWDMLLFQNSNIQILARNFVKKPKYFEEMKYFDQNIFVHHEF